MTHQWKLPKELTLKIDFDKRKTKELNGSREATIISLCYHRNITEL